MIGPLCGTFIQPLIGATSDRSTSRYGKRRPFIMAGISGSVLAMISLSLMRMLTPKAYRLIAHNFVAPQTMNAIAKGLVIFWICVLNLSLQSLQVGLRALIIDRCPNHQQTAASAWTGRLTGLGAISTYILDHVIINQYPKRSFEVLCIYTSASLVLTNLPSIILVQERANSPIIPPNATSKASGLIVSLLRTAKEMPVSIKHICIVQFASWLGWFPFLYYNTTYISDLGARENRTMNGAPSSSGVQAYFLFGLVSFYCSIVLPWMKPVSTPQSKQTSSRSWLVRVQQHFRITLPSLWIFSQLLFAGCMFSTIFIEDSTSGIIMVATAGISWALTQWIPLAMMSAEIANLKQLSSCSASEEDGVSDEAQTGTLMSIFNAAISAPQIIASFLCSGLFWVLDGADQGEAIVWIMSVAGGASILAAILLVGLRK
jgi:solute carrier family 45 protein 1/2/4